MKKVCVIIPAYNESSVIKDVIKKAKKVFSKAKKDYLIDIVLINDGSKDNTLEQARKGGAIVIDHILNSGAGGATLTGLAYARQHGYDIVATMDADGQHDPEDVLAGIRQSDNSNTDLLIGSRLINSEGMSRTKVLGNKGLSFITYALFGINVTDSQSGLRVYSRRAIDNLDWKIDWLRILLRDDLACQTGRHGNRWISNQGNLHRLFPRQRPKQLERH